MTKKILAFAVAAAVSVPMAAQAELKLSGTIQAELGTLEIAGGDRQTVNDSYGGTVHPDGGMNKIRFDFDEKIGGLDAFGRIDWAYSTSDNANSSNLTSREQYVGLKGSGAHFKVGRIQGIYKTTGDAIDPFGSTGGQARGIGGGRSGGAFGHGSYIDNVLEVGFKGGDFSLAAQTVADESGGKDGSWLLGVNYSSKVWGVWGAASSEASNVAGADDPMNLKVGGYAKFGGLTAALQYEKAENGNYHVFMNKVSATGNGVTSEEGRYITGSLAYGLGSWTLAGWVSSYSADKMVGLDTVNNSKNEADAMSWSLGAIYSLSKRTAVYGAYHSSDSDLKGVNAAGAVADDVADWNAFAVGVFHNF